MYTILCRCVHLNVLSLLFLLLLPHFSSLCAHRMNGSNSDKKMHRARDCVPCAALCCVTGCVSVWRKKRVTKFINKNRYDKRFTTSGQHRKKLKIGGYHMNGVEWMKNTICHELVQTRTCQVNNDGSSSNNNNCSSGNGGGGSNPTQRLNENGIII